MAGERVLHQVQYGLEGATHGTPVAADTMLLGEVTLPSQDREVVIPGWGTGERMPGQLDAAFVRRILAEGAQFATPSDRGGLYYQLLPLIWSIGVKGNITPAEQNGGEGDYLWTFAAPLSGAETLDSMTLEAGDDARAYELAYVMASEIVLSGNTDSGEVELTATLFGDKITATTFTGALSIPSATYAIGKLMRVYVDDTWAGIGTTELADALLDWRLRISGGVNPKLRGSSSRVIDAHGQGELEVSLELGLERTAGVATEEDYYLATTVTPRFVRLVLDSGIQIGAGDNHQIMIDLAGAWTAWQAFGRDQDGNTLDVATLTVGKDATGSAAFELKVTTDVATI